MSNKTVVWTRTARTDLEMIIQYIAVDSVDNALTILGKLERKVASLNAQSGRGRVVPELNNVGVALYHEVITKPWRIIYRLDNDRVVIMAVLDSRRDLEDILLQRLTDMPQ